MSFRIQATYQSRLNTTAVGFSGARPLPSGQGGLLDSVAIALQRPPHQIANLTVAELLTQLDTDSQQPRPRRPGIDLPEHEAEQGFLDIVQVSLIRLYQDKASRQTITAAKALEELGKIFQHKV